MINKEISWSNLKAVSITLLLCAAASVPDQAQTFKTLVDFDGTNGAHPERMSPVQGRDANLYGTTSAGGYTPMCIQGCGTVFRVSRTGKLIVIYNFYQQPGDPIDPAPGLTLATNGGFYGTTVSGGPANAGVVFEVISGGQMATLYNFCTLPNCADGSDAYGQLTEGLDGNFYGTTSGFGYAVPGTIFRMTPTGDLTTLYTFPSSGRPTGKLVLATDGNFYGTNFGNGSDCALYSCGTIFRVTPSGVLTTMHTFAGLDGSEPWAGIVQASDGNFYGTTVFGGAAAGGTVFKMTPGGKFQTIYSFCGRNNCSDGYLPYAPLAQATDGNLYGVTADGGDTSCTYGCGTVFKITLQGELTTLHSFTGNDGMHPEGGLLQSTNGILYGATLGGGDLTCTDPLGPGCGTIFSLDMGLGPFITFVRAAGKVGQTGGILGQGFTGTTDVSLNGVPANFTVVSDTYINATVPAGATTGYVTVTTPTGVLTSNVPFHVLK